MDFQFGGATVLEVGFGGNWAADLIHCERLGAKVYGSDINESAVIGIGDDGHFGGTVALQHAGREPIPFETTFDLIYSRDTLYYLSDDELQYFFADVAGRVQESGLVVVQFIEADYGVGESSVSNCFTDLDLRGARRVAIAGPDNPIRLLVPGNVVEAGRLAGLTVVGSKWHVQTYDRWGQMVSSRSIPCILADRHVGQFGGDRECSSERTSLVISSCSRRANLYFRVIALMRSGPGFHGVGLNVIHVV